LNPKVAPNLGVNDPVVIPRPNATVDPKSGATIPQPQQTTVDPNLKADPNHRVPFSCIERLKACQADNGQLKAENASLNSQLQKLQAQNQQYQDTITALKQVATCKDGHTWVKPNWPDFDCWPYACGPHPSSCYSSCQWQGACAGSGSEGVTCHADGRCVQD
jgi:hypothetical protein